MDNGTSIPGQLKTVQLPAEIGKPVRWKKSSLIA